MDTRRTPPGPPVSPVQSSRLVGVLGKLRDCTTTALLLCLLLGALWSCATSPPPAPRVHTSDVRVLMVVTSSSSLMDGTSAGYYLSEVVDFYEVVNAAGIAIDIASPRGGLAPMYDRSTELSGGSMPSFLESTGLLADLDDTIPLSAIDPTKYAGVYYVGGFAAVMDFPTDPGVASVGAGVYEAGGVVAAVCHGPAALVNLQLSNGDYLVDGKEVTSRTVQEDERLRSRLPILVERELRARGAVYSKRAPGAGYVVEDGRVITGQGPAATKEVAERFVAALQRP